MRKDSIIIRDKTVVEIDPERPVIALTFDDGPNDSYTIKILDILYENKSTATFFINGMNIDGNEDILRKIVKEGNEIGNHTYDHADLTQLKEDEIKKQINKTQKQVNKVLGDYKLLNVRPPYGRYNEKVLNAIDFPVSLWTLDSHDWETENSEDIYKLVVNSAKDLDVIVMHDSSEYTVDAVRKIIPELREKGFQFVTLTQLYKYREENPEAHSISW
jgi:peptidoglycan/xylan/chitin deacetylase (PgdA/CDA1 family)